MIEFGKLHQDLPYELYSAACEAGNMLRSSHLKPLKRSPAHLQAYLAQPREETEALRQGKLIHKLFENPEKFMETKVVEPEFTGKTKDGRDSKRSGEAKQAKADWHASLPPGTIVLSQEDVTLVEGIWNALRSKSLVRAMLSGGVSESSMFVRDPQTGVHLACRPDLISKHGHVMDFKSTLDAGRDHFLRSVFSSSRSSPFYILSAAHYAHCMRISGVGSGESFTFIAIEKSPPYEMAVYPMDTGCLAVGEQWRDTLTKQYAECLSTGKWPGYADKAFPVAPPQWARVPDEEWE